MRFSVAIPTFQRRDLVLDAIASVLAQDKAADEIIVVDDGSTDGSADAIQREFGPAVRLVRQDNRGVSAARNAAAALARGDLIAFLDDDDRWLPSHLETIEALALRHPTAVLISTCHNAWFGTEAVSQSVCLDMTEALLLGTDWVGPPSGVAVPRRAYLDVGGCDTRLRLAEDVDLYLRLSLVGPAALISATTFERRVQPDSLSERGLNEKLHLNCARLLIAKFLERLDAAEVGNKAALRRAAGSRLAMEATIAALSDGARLSISPQQIRALERRTIGKVR
jgi:glycosyltransferase involved in cell wall biosynthesis